MALTTEQLQKYTRRMLLARLRILNSHGFYGLLLMHMKFAVDEHLGTMATDGVRIFFDPKFLDELSDEEVEFVLMHEILHVVLRHCLRGKEDETRHYHHELFNIACDIVVNSNILLSNNNDVSTITLEKYGISMHLAPNGSEGHKYTAEEVYDMLLSSMSGIGKTAHASNGRKKGSAAQPAGQKDSNAGLSPIPGAGEHWDDHSRWNTSGEDPDALNDEWNKRLIDACEAISARDPGNKRGLLPAFAERLLKELIAPKSDWREILNDFVQEEITDYSFTPPDKRFDDVPFFLPDFNEKEDYVQDILFMIDTSGSMSDALVTAAYSEVKGAIDQFDGRLKGWLGFFDAKVIPPEPFENLEEFRVIRPKGGGGTNFSVIFSYINKKMQDPPPASIIILTDGYAPFPKETATMGIPVLWMLTNDLVTPPWGKIARITQ